MVVDINCANCPFAVDRDYGRSRLYCAHLDKMVKTHHTSGTDCYSVLAVAMSDKLQTSVSV